jgi:hypothetical protein
MLHGVIAACLDPGITQSAKFSIQSQDRETSGLLLSRFPALRQRLNPAQRFNVTVSDWHSLALKEVASHAQEFTK